MKKVIYSIFAGLSVLLVAMVLFVACGNEAKSCDKKECDATCCPAHEKDGEVKCSLECDKPCCAEAEKKCCKKGDAKTCDHHKDGEAKKCCAGKDSVACAEHKAAMEMDGKMCKKDCKKACCADKKLKMEVEEEKTIEKVIEE